jgi:hypothetical protein
LTKQLEVRHHRPVRPLRTVRLPTAPARTRPAQERAAAHLRFIRDTMERAGSFTAVSGWGQVAAGAVGLLAGLAARRQADALRWLAVWLSAAALGAVIAVVAIWRKARRLGTPLVSGPGRRFGLAFLTPLASGAILTVVFAAGGRIDRLPGVWLLLFGTAVMSGGALSVRAVPVMGACFMVLGIAAFALPAGWGNLLMIAGFAGLHIAFGVYIGMKHGG